MNLLRITVDSSPGNPLLRVHVERTSGQLVLHIDAPAPIALDALAQLIASESDTARGGRMRR